MKAIQVMLDEELLEQLDASEEVRHRGRSAVLRQAAADYLARQRRRSIRERYEKAYGSDGGLGEGFSGWENQGTGPDE